MTFEIRTLTDDDLPAAVAISSYSFNAPTRDLTPYIERARRVSSPQWYLGAFEDGEMTAMMQTIPTEMYLNGATIPMGCVGPVASSPLHRRKGHTGRMLRQSLAWMKERGHVISGLTTPHPALYRRYGWEIAADRRNHSFKPKDFQPQRRPGQRGRFRMLQAGDWQTLDAVYQRYAVTHNGPLRRDEGWWRDYVLGLPWDPVSDIVLWESDAGEPQGYALYKQPGAGDSGNRLYVHELITVSGDAYLNLLMYFAGHDLYEEITLRAPSRDALQLVFSDTDRLTTRERYTVMLRVCDFESAMRQRPAAREDETASVTLHIDDPDAAWHTGTWHVGVAEGRTFAERSQLQPELHVSGGMLGSLYNGFMAPSVAASAGLLATANQEALERADRIFAARQSPFFPDTF